MEMIGRLAIVQGDGLADKVRGGFGLALLQCNHAQQMQGVHALWIGSQGFAVKRGSLLQLAAAVQADRFREHAANIQTRQFCAFPGLPVRTLCTATQPPCAVGKFIAVEASRSAGRLACIDFV